MIVRTHRRQPLLIWLCATGILLGANGNGSAQETSPAVNLTVRAGRPLRVALDGRLRIERTGQPVTGTIVEPIYAYDRVVIPAGVKVAGHVSRIDRLSKMARMRAFLGGDLTPNRNVVLEFDTLRLDDGDVAIQTVVTSRIENLRLLVAGSADSSAKTGRTTRARAEILHAGDELKGQARDALATIKRPGRMARLRDAAIQRLPFHPQIVDKGTVYNAELVNSVDFGSVTPIEKTAGTPAAPSSILSARLVTPVDSADTPRGTPIVAVLTEPVFSKEHALVLPEGTELLGEVTFSKGAAHFHRNGQLRLLFETVHPPEEQPARLLASLHAVQASGDDHVTIDEEGGTTINNSKTRFLRPAIALLALNASADLGGETETGNLAAASTVEGTNVAGRGLGGFFGFGLLGVGISQLSRPVAVGIAAIGAARSVYTSVFGKGKEVAFPADTPIQVQLAAGPK